MAEWLCSGLQIRVRRFDSGLGLQFFPDPESARRPATFRREGESPRLTFGGEEEGAAAVGIGVNAFLWRATLDTISFMPLLSADPFGGVIITDWYAPPETPDERFKMTVYILTRTLRSDGVQVSVFRQGRGDDGLWEDRATNPDTAVSLEDKILDRARQIRTASLQ